MDCMVITLTGVRGSVWKSWTRALRSWRFNSYSFLTTWLRFNMIYNLFQFQVNMSFYSGGLLMREGCNKKTSVNSFTAKPRAKCPPSFMLVTSYVVFLYLHLCFCLCCLQPESEQCLKPCFHQQVWVGTGHFSPKNSNL